MRLGVLDIGSDPGHLLVVDAHGGAAPLPAYSLEQQLRLAEHLDGHLDETGAVSRRGVEASTDVARVRRARDAGHLIHVGVPDDHLSFLGSGQ